VSHLKQCALNGEDVDPSEREMLFVASEAGKDLDMMVRGCLEFGEAVPNTTPAAVSCRLLLSYLRALPDPVVTPEASTLLSEAIQISDDGQLKEYQLVAIRCTIQSSLPYNHRVVLQLLVSLLSRMQDTGLEVDGAITELSQVMFAEDCDAAVSKTLLQLLFETPEVFPTSNTFVQYMVEKSKRGRMAVKSAEYGMLINLLTHRFMQEKATTQALFCLYSRWLPSVDELLSTLTEQHRRFLAAADSSWGEKGRAHILVLMQAWVSVAPEMLLVPETWASVRGTARAWQKEAPDGGGVERKLRKWLKQRHKMVEGEYSANLECVKGIAELEAAPSEATMSWEQLLKTGDAVRMAEQIALVDMAFFRAVPKAELLERGSGVLDGYCWNRLVMFFNSLSGWVVSAVLGCALPSLRAEAIVFFIKTADHLQNVLADYNGSYAIISALSDANIDRLKQTWNRVAQNYVDLHLDLQELWAISRNFARYRDELQRARTIPPAIPYCGMLSKDLFAVEENNRSDQVSSPSGGADHVNVDKLRLLWEKMEAFLHLQKAASYSKLEANPQVQAFLVKLGKPGGFPLLEPGTYKSVSLSLEKRGGGGGGESLTPRNLN
jgi:hypothetical protein